MSCRTGPLRVGRSLRDLYTGLGKAICVGLPLVGAIFLLPVQVKKWGTKELRLSVIGLKDSRTPMPQQSWSIIQRPRTV
jgi:hypothetical protein